MPIVELRLARIPGPIGRIAAHYWFVVLPDSEEEAAERWELWQDRDVRGESWGHLHRNLKPPLDGVGNGSSWVEGTFTGGEAERLVEALWESTRSYPDCHRYRSFPGPNSNTWVQWILDHSGCGHRLGTLGIGRGWCRWLRQEEPHQSTGDSTAHSPCGSTTD